MAQRCRSVFVLVVYRRSTGCNTCFWQKGVLSPRHLDGTLGSQTYARIISNPLAVGSRVYYCKSYEVPPTSSSFLGAIAVYQPAITMIYLVNVVPFESFMSECTCKWVRTGGLSARVTFRPTIEFAMCMVSRCTRDFGEFTRQIGLESFYSLVRECSCKWS
ncbi:hypothetical protein EDB87DRAFT_1628269 [Lactarius vividus]|nr:hypothetical protein EDB87DRAFT_1628269 [Lactarius vividus]